METEKDRHCKSGLFLEQSDSKRSGKRKTRHWKMTGILLFWDGFLIYMIGNDLIERVCGAIFVAAVSIYLGIQF